MSQLLAAQHELLLQIIERPDDDGLRLVLADRLTGGRPAHAASVEAFVEAVNGSLLVPSQDAVAQHLKGKQSSPP